MKADAVVGLVAIPLAVLITFSLFFVTAAIGTKKARSDTLKTIEALDFRSNAVLAVVSLWSAMFHRIFGRHFFSWRRAAAVPIYTALVSALCFIVWLGSIFLLRNPKHLLIVSLPLDFRQGLSQYYWGDGYVASLVIDFIAVQFTVWCISIGVQRGFFSLRFLLAFFSSLFVSGLLFTLAVYAIRTRDMESLYALVAPYDDPPPAVYAPISYIATSLNFFHPLTLLYASTRGLYGDYFMPEPVLLYSAIVSHLSLVAVAMGYALAAGLVRMKQLSIGFVRAVGKPKIGAYSVVITIYAGLFSVLLLTVIVYILV